jgi:DNA helicase-2/ATP-dependent DNA helicase PcrA
MISYKAVLADEAQDLSLLQYLFLRRLSKGASLTVIGDPAQSIYGFRGAMDSLERRLREDRLDLKVLSLPFNHRSLPFISDVSESFRKEGGPKRRTFSKARGGRVVRASLDNPLGEALYIGKVIKEKMGGMRLGGGSEANKDALPGLSFGDVAVVFRFRAQGEEILKTLLEEGLPCQISGEDEPETQDGLDLKSEKISLITAHAAKGLEFRLVFISGLEEGLFPPENLDSISKREETWLYDREAEEERLFYVALTRAKELLYLTRAKKRRIFGKVLSGNPSPFWERIPQEKIREAHPGRMGGPRTTPLF